MVYLLIYTFALTLAEPPTIAVNCLPLNFDEAHQFVLEFQARKPYMKCEKREGIYEWMCNNNNAYLWVHTIKKDPEDCRQTPDRMLDHLRTMMKKPTL